MAKIINFLQAKSALEISSLEKALRQQREREAKPAYVEKKTAVVTALPGESFPEGIPDLRPALQRDGLVLLGWLKWDDFYGGAACIAGWINSCVPYRRYTSDIFREKEAPSAQPQKLSSQMFYTGKLPNARWQGKVIYFSANDNADSLYLAAPFLLSSAVVPDFVKVLKAAETKVNFDFHFTLGQKKQLAFEKQREEIAAAEKAALERQA